MIIVLCFNIYIRYDEIVLKIYGLIEDLVFVNFFWRLVFFFFGFVFYVYLKKYEMLLYSS